LVLVTVVSVPLVYLERLGLAVVVDDGRR